MTTDNREVIIIGGGLAGLTVALMLAPAGRQVLLIEKQQYPFHKVCGEYVSAEVLPFLQSIGADPTAEWQLPVIRRLMLTTNHGRSVEAKLDSGAFGISRYRFDHFLYEKAVAAGAEVMQGTTVTGITWEGDGGVVKIASGKEIRGRVIIGAYGKHSNIDRLLGRPFFSQRSPYIGVKHHFRFPVPADLVALHNFPGGYCGVSQVEDGITNVCYLTVQQNLKKAGSIDAMEKTILGINPYLREIMQQGEKLFAEPKVISQVSFLPKHPVDNHILMAGDTAGLIAPLAGNGMAMAIHSGALAASWVKRYLSGEINRAEMEEGYGREWERNFRQRLHTGNRLQALFGKSFISSSALVFFGLFPALLRSTIKRTHGSPLVIHA